MAVGAFIFLILFFSVYLEILAGLTGIIIPLSAISIFYLSVTFGWKSAMLLGIVTGTVIDMLYGRSIIITPYLMMLTVAAGTFWLHKGDPVSIMPHLIPGATVALIVTLPLLAFSTYRTDIYLSNLYKLAISAVSGSLLLPIMIALFDYLAFKLGLPLYRKAKAAVLDKR